MQDDEKSTNLDTETLLATSDPLGTSLNNAMLQQARENGTIGTVPTGLELLDKFEPRLCSLLLDLHGYLTEHEGEEFTSQKQLALKIGREETAQSDISDVLLRFVNYFNPVKAWRNNKYYPKPLPDAIIEECNRRIALNGNWNGEYEQREPIEAMFVTINKKLDKLAKTLDTKPQPEPSKLPAFLDRAIIDKAYERNPGYCEWAPIAQLRFDQKLLVFIRLLHELEDNADEVMQTISNAWKK